MAWSRLALVQAADDPQALAELAEVFGYAKEPDPEVESHQRLTQVGTQSAVSLGQNQARDDTVYQRPPARFLRINKISKTEPDPKDRQAPSYLSDPAIRLQAQKGGAYQFAAPQPLMPIARLLPLLFNSLAQAKAGRSLDHRQLIKRIAQGKPLQHLPKQVRLRWPQRLQIIVDTSDRLEPYWTDFAAIVKQLRTLLGQEALEVLRFDEQTLGDSECYCQPWPTAEQPQWRLWQAPPADVAVLILGDLGYADSRASVAWRRQLAALQNHPSPILTLNPASASGTDKRLCRQFKLTPFNDSYPVPRHPLTTGFSFSEPSAPAIKDMLTWLAQLPLIDTGLLRRLRLAMQWGDSSLETLIWNHPAIRDIGLGRCLAPDYAKTCQSLLQQKLAGSDKAKLFWEIVADHHQTAYQGLRQLEIFKQCLSEQQALPDDTREYFQALCKAGLQSASNPAKQHLLRGQGRTVLAFLPDSIWNSQFSVLAADFSQLAYDLYAVTHEDEIRNKQLPQQLPPGFNPERLLWVAPPTNTEEKQVWHLVQLGDQGQIYCGPCSIDNEPQVITFNLEVGSDLPPRLTLSNVNETYLHKQGYTVTLAENATAILACRGLSVEIESILRPTWASRIWRNVQGLWCSIPWLQQELDVFWQVTDNAEQAAWRWPAPFAEDELGLYVDLNVKNATQRFRWIKPGSFWMGSPVAEVDREWGGNESGKGTETLHQVTLSQGFWLADTAVSQIFWLTVMGQNPSKFTDNLENPVEQVSWQDAQQFIAKLNSLFPGLLATLPTEAQWEYACRAGTQTPFSFGDNISPEQVNYHGNFPYAEGRKGLYRQQTVPVKSLPANSWGLYQMHGNVYEWCADAWQQDVSAEPVTDPEYRGNDLGSARVVRGGSWSGDGWFVRSADRFRLSPDFRDSYLGFRLALGHAEFSSGSGSKFTQELAVDTGLDSRVAEQRQSRPVSTAGAKSVADWSSQLKKLFSQGDKNKK